MIDIDIKNRELISSASSPIPIVFTSPLLDTIVKNKNSVITWTTTGTEFLRLTDAYQVRVFSQPGCVGTVINTVLTNSPSYNLTNILDRNNYSISVGAFNAKSVLSDETCSFTVTGDAIISMLKIPSSGYLALDVDFTNKMAYLGRLDTNGLDAIDFFTETAPTLFKSINSTTTPSSAISVSRGVAIYNNGQRMVVAGNGSSSIELWDLTSNPRGAWVKLGTLNGLSSVRKIAKIDTTDPLDTVVTLALRSGIAIVNINEATNALSVVRRSTAFSNGHGAGAIMGNWMISPNANAAGPLDLINLTTLLSDTTYPFPDQGHGANMWSAASNSNGTKGFSAGVIGGFFSYNLTTPSVYPVNTMRFDFNTTNGNMRDATFVNEFGKELCYVVRGKTLDVWDTTDINSPILIGEQILTDATSEAYGVRVDNTNHRAYVVTSGGDFFIINTEMIPPAFSTYVTF